MIWLLLALLFWATPVAADDLTNVQWLTCYDGDTCSFNIYLPAPFGTDLGVRFSGIDAPEINGKCDKEKVLALAARDFLRTQMTGAKIVLQNVFRDKYFRVEAIVMANGVNLNQVLVEQGFAVPYTGSGPRHDWCL